MPKRALFINKLLGRLDKVDKDSVQNYLSGLSQENSALREILDHLTEGVLLVTSKGKFIFANRQASLWLGLPPEPNAKASAAGLVADSELSQFLATRIPNLKERLIGDLQILVPREMTLRVILLPIREKGQEDSVLVLFDDISGMTGSADEKFSRIEALSSLAAGIAHEIGNPLNSINIHLELLKKEIKSLPDTKQKPFDKVLRVLQNETERLDRIVRSFLKATRKPPLRFKHEDLNSILEEAVKFLAPELDKKDITYDFKLDKTLPQFLLDRERLYMAFINLLKNAMEAMPHGGSITAGITHKDNVVSVSFKDTGVGIPEKDLPHIFEAYYTTKEEGSGLGLMTVYQIVREHGGRIDVSSRTGKGTVFVLHLPVRQPKLQLTQ